MPYENCVLLTHTCSVFYALKWDYCVCVRAKLYMCKFKGLPLCKLTAGCALMCMCEPRTVSILGAYIHNTLTTHHIQRKKTEKKQLNDDWQ